MPIVLYFRCLGFFFSLSVPAPNTSASTLASNHRISLLIPTHLGALKNILENASEVASTDLSLSFVEGLLLFLIEVL